MRYSAWAVAALAGSATLILAACGSSSSTAPSTGSTSAASSSSAATGAGTSSFTGCMVTDTGGIDDRSFNATSWLGMQDAKTKDSKVSDVKFAQSTTQADYVPNITNYVNSKCGIIVTVGFLMGDATQAAAKANPNQKFAIVDFSYTPTLANVDGLLFDTSQDAYLGGYLAAGMSKTGVVATFGGQKIPPVTIYMDGFWDGVQAYNQKHGTHVKVLGWDETTQNGSFTGDFTNQTKGQQLTQSFIAENADIIFPVAGNVGLGAAKAVQQADQQAGTQKVNMMWVDTDGCVSAQQYCKYFITSVTKGIDTAVSNAVTAAADGTFQGGVYVGNLSNGGVGLAPFHDFASSVPASLQNELNTVKQDIISGTIKVATKSGV